MPRHLVLVGGGAGTGKTTLARGLARDLDAHWLQLDTVWLAMRALAVRCPSVPSLDVPSVVGDPDLSDAEALRCFLATAEVVCDALPELLAFELGARPRLVVDGAWLLPSVVAGLSIPDTRTTAVVLGHRTRSDLTAALAPRLAGRERTARHEVGDRRLHATGTWLVEQARRHGVPVVESLPFDDLLERVRPLLPPGQPLD